MVHLGMYTTEEDAMRVFDFAVLSLCGVGGKRVMTNFDRDTYLGANGALLPVEAALPGLGHHEHSFVRDKLAAAMGLAGAAAGAPDGGSDDGSGSQCKSNSDHSAGLAIPARVHTHPGSAALGAEPCVSTHGPASAAGITSGGHGQAAGAQQGSAALGLPPHQPLPQSPLPRVPSQQQLSAAPPPPLTYQPLPQVPQAQQAQQLPAAPPHTLPNQPLPQVPQAQQTQQQLPPAPAPPTLLHPLPQVPHQQQQVQQQQQQQVPLAPPAHAVSPAEGPPRDYRSKTAALAFLIDLQVAFSNGVLPLDVFEEQQTQAMVDLRRQ
ncbi:hypothetical protein FOA52_003590 [Chlamydomonas sp. UWO 241]|nr:hypothetical protein FOA52_003590 [Chlamydomonas sp. UWO 241]